MPQPTLDSVTFNPGTGAVSLAADLVSSKFWQAILVGYSTGDGSANVVATDAPLPVTASAWPLPAGAATAAAQTDGSQKAIARGAAKGATTAADVTSTAQGSDHQSLDVQIYHGGAAVNPAAPVLAAGPNLIGRTASAQDTNVVYDGTTALPVKSFVIACGSSGDNTLVNLVATKKVRVLSLFVAAAKASTAAVGLHFKSSGGTAISGDATHQLALDKTAAAGAVGLSLPFSPSGHFETPAGEALVAVLDAAQAIMGHGKYIEV
jgi:hypothetical protein